MGHIHLLKREGMIFLLLVPQSNYFHPREWKYHSIPLMEVKMPFPLEISPLKKKSLIIKIVEMNKTSVKISSVYKKKSKGNEYCSMQKSIIYV